MMRVALTGGIASGKTTVSNLFADLGVSIIDTDVIARELVMPGADALAEIRRHFGEDVITAQGELDRAAMRERVFSSPEKRRRLEAILHPRIMAEAGRRVGQSDGRYCIVVIPLLVEAGLTAWPDRILVVDVPEEIQRQRVIQRDGLDEQQATDVLAAQASRAQRLAVADDVICNDKSPDDLRAPVKRLHEQYLNLAGRVPSAGRNSGLSGGDLRGE